MNASLPGPARFACLLVPDLPLVAALRAHPELVGRPLAITSGPGPRAELLAVSPEAERCGVRPLATAVHARAACAGLHLCVSSPTLERAAREALYDVALSASPRVEAAPAGAGPYAAEAAVYLDASGTSALFHSEAGLAAALATRAARLGLPACVAIASSRSTALIAARTLARESGRARSEAQPSGAHQSPARESGRARSENTAPPRLSDTSTSRRPASAAGARSEPQASEVHETCPTLVLPPGGDAAFLAPLPIDLLDPDDALAETLHRFGIRRVGDLVRLPRRALLTRLGAAAHPLLARARGEEHAAFPAARRDARLTEAIDLEAPLERLEPLAFVLRGLLSRLVERLDCRGLGCGDLDLAFALEGGGRDARRVGVAAPTGDPRVLLRLVTLSLEARPPCAAVAGIALSTEGRPVRGDQLDFFRPAGPAPAVLSRTLAELEALCGPGRVGSPAVADSHRPDACALTPFTPTGTASLVRDADASPSGRLALRALRPPVCAQVRASGGDRPLWIRSAVANGRVLSAAGPWRTTGGWWSEGERFAFDHFDVLTEDGTLSRLRLDRLHHRWEIDAVYD